MTAIMDRLVNRCSAEQAIAIDTMTTPDIRRIHIECFCLRIARTKCWRAVNLGYAILTLQREAVINVRRFNAKEEIALSCTADPNRTRRRNPERTLRVREQALIV